MTYFDPKLPNPAADGYPGALRFLGNGQGREGKRTFYSAGRGDGPRAGLAFQATSKTVVRAGFGIYYAANRTVMPRDGFIASPAYTSVNSGIDPAFYWDAGWPAWVVPPSMNPGYAAGSGVTWPQDPSSVPTSTTWNLAISHALPGNIVADITYTGVKGTHLASPQVNYMQIDPQYARLGSLLNKQIDDPAVQALGFRAPFPSFKRLLKNNATLGQSLRMFPQYTSVTTNGMYNRSGNSTYNALIMKLTKRYSSGLTFMGSYVWSKTLTDSDDAEPGLVTSTGAGLTGGPAQNQYNRRPQKSYGTIDQASVLKATVAYDLPFGPRRRLLNAGAVARIVGRWTVGLFTLAQTGFPLGAVDSGYSNYLNAGPALPNVVTHDWRASQSGSSFDPSKDLYFNASAFVRRTNPALDPFGNAPILNGATRSFPVIRQNVTATREFSVTEKAKLNLRWEVFDLFNAKTWANPGNNLGNMPMFGMITSASGNRTMQVCLKLAF